MEGNFTGVPSQIGSESKQPSRAERPLMKLAEIAPDQKKNQFRTFIPEIEYRESDVEDLKVKGSYNDKGRFEVDYVVLDDGAEVRPSGRFWNSLCARFGFGPSIYSYFSHEEVFNRVSEVMRASAASSNSKTKKDRVRLCVQKTPHFDFRPTESFPKWEPTLLAVSGLDACMMFDDQIKNVLAKQVPESLSFKEGVITTGHKLRRGIDLDIGGDIHTTTISLDTPIDGYGRPNIYLALLRQVCTNGAIAYAKTFRSGIVLGKGENAPLVLERALDGFNNEDGFMAMKQRLESAQRSQASVFEARKLAKILWAMPDTGFSDNYLKSRGLTLDAESHKNYALREPLLEQLGKKTGDLRAIYGVAQIDSVSEKRQRALATKCRVYDLLILATEIATHQTTPTFARGLHAFFGDTIAKEFDMEGSADAFEKFDDFIEPTSRFARDFSMMTQN